MSLAGFAKNKKKKKKKKKHKPQKVISEPVTNDPSPEDVIEVAQNEPAETDHGGWISEVPHIHSSNALASKVGVVDVNENSKPVSDTYARDVERNISKHFFQDARRAFVENDEKKNDAPKPVPVPKYGKPRASRLNITDTNDFPSLGGSAPAAAPQPAVTNNMWTKTVEENAELIHIALKAEKKLFEPSSQLYRFQYGYFFKNGPEGLGYYKDPHPRHIYAVPDPVEETVNVAESKEGEQATSRFGKKKKKKKKTSAEGEDGETKKDKKKKKKKKDKDGVDGDSKKEKKKKKKKKIKENQPVEKNEEWDES